MQGQLDDIEGDILIYGAHLVAVECCRYLVHKGKYSKIVGVAVTNMAGNPRELEGFPVKEINTYRKRQDNLTVVIAMPEKYHTVVEAYVKELGFKDSVKVSLEAMSILKGRQLLLEQQMSSEFEFLLEESIRDSSWLNIKELSGRTDRYYKFPTLFYKSIKDVFKETRQLKFQKDYQRILGEYRNLHCILEKNVLDTEFLMTNILQVYMVFSKGDSAAVSMNTYAPWICPLHAGKREGKTEIFCMHDDVGDSIADKNSVLAEMTGAYWIWRNIDNVSYKGLCHYRRHFIISENEIRALNQNGVDVILTIPRYVPFGVGNMFLAETPVKKRVFESMYQAVHECAPEDESLFRDYMSACFYYPNNMVIARSNIYDSYCEWVFRILFRMFEIDQDIGYKHVYDRHLAYAAELLTSFYFAKNRNKYQIAVTEYQFLLGESCV